MNDRHFIRRKYHDMNSNYVCLIVSLIELQLTDQNQGLTVIDNTSG